MKKDFDVILKHINQYGIDATRKIIYGDDIYQTIEAEAMRLFLISRQEWIIDNVLEKLKKHCDK